MSKTLGDVIKEYRDTHSLSMEQFGKVAGLSKAYVSMLEKNKDPRTGKPINPSLETYYGVAQAIGIDVNTLMASVGSNQNIFVGSESPQNTIEIPTTSIPLLGTIAAGVPILAEQNIECYVDVNKFVKADFALRVQGDSMIGAGIYDGDIVFIRRQPDVENGEIAAVMMIDENTSDGVATLKRVYKTSHGLQLVAENKNYAPILIDQSFSEGVAILGKATYFLSSVK